MKPILIEVCAGTTCHLMGAADLLAALKDLPTETREHVRVAFSACLGSCADGPNVRIDGVIHRHVVPEHLPLLVAAAVNGEDE